MRSKRLTHRTGVPGAVLHLIVDVHCSGLSRNPLRVFYARISERKIRKKLKLDRIRSHRMATEDDDVASTEIWHCQKPVIVRRTELIRLCEVCEDGIQEGTR